MSRLNCLKLILFLCEREVRFAANWRTEPGRAGLLTKRFDSLAGWKRIGTASRRRGGGRERTAASVLQCLIQADIGSKKNEVKTGPVYTQWCIIRLVVVGICCHVLLKHAGHKSMAAGSLYVISEDGVCNDFTASATCSTGEAS